MDIPVEIISDPDRLKTAMGEIENSGVIALDIESNSRHRYPEQLCLIQLATPRAIYIIDTLVISDISSLENVLLSRDTVKVFHEASNDIRSLDRHYGFQVHSIFDTAIAARFCGIDRHGLADVIDSVMGISIDKSERVQRSDWGRRPLSEESLEYAATDVRHLIFLGEALIQRLDDLGRMEWVTEECLRLEDLSYEEPDPETFYRSIKGSGRLKGKALAILRELHLFRESMALQYHKPPSYIMPDRALVYLASNPATDLSEVPGLGKKISKRLGPGIKEAIAKGMDAPTVYRKRQTRTGHKREAGQERLTLTRQQRERNFKRLKEWREATAANLSLDPSLIWPLVSLERLAKRPDTLETELMYDGLRQWQREEFSSNLAELVESF